MPGTPEAPETPASTKQLEFLFDYTKFHIGIYTTLGTLMVSIMGLEPWKTAAGQSLLAPHVPSLRVSMLFMLSAGCAGGVIASNIPHAKTFEAFVEDPLNVWGRQAGRYAAWAWIEHYAFWMAVVVAASSFLLSPTAWPWVLAAGAVGVVVRLLIGR
jgi:hypothetical protein